MVNFLENATFPLHNVIATLQAIALAESRDTKDPDEPERFTGT